MSRFKLPLLLILVTILPYSISYAKQAPPVDSIDVFIRQVMQQRKIPALQLAVVRDGQLAKLKTYGTANLENKIAAANYSMFNINSITKAFVGVAIMQLSELGKLKVTDPIAKYLDSLPTAWREVTIQQVLSHTSGLPDILDENEQVFGDGDESLAMKKVKSLPVEFAPGQKFRYNQTGYVMLGQIITKLSGRHFTDFIIENQFTPAGLQLTRFGDSFDVIPNSAGAYTNAKYIAGKFVRVSSPGVSYIQFPTFYRTAAGIVSTAEEMAKWMMALQSMKLLKDAKSLTTLWAAVPLNNGTIAGFNALTNGYALGWPTITRAAHPAVAPVGGGRSAVVSYLNDNLTIIVLTNLMGANPERFTDEIAGFYIPEMKQENGFGLPMDIQKLRTAMIKNKFVDGQKILAKLRKSDASLKLNERELNAWAYQLLSERKQTEALAIFKLITHLYPSSANAYDSLAEALEANGDQKSALANYKKSLELDERNDNARNRIKVLTQ